jgi:uncharacterized protein with HEPN domain
MSSCTRKWKFRIRHMLQAIDRIVQYAGTKSKDELKSDQLTLDAIVWNLTVLGEAARHVPENVVEAYPEVPWPQMRGIRNRIVHGYDRIDFQIVWDVIQQELSPLVPQLEQIMQEADD